MREIAIIKGPWRDPVAALSPFAEEPWALGLLSDGNSPQARWSYLARRPDQVFVSSAETASDPFQALTALLGPAAPSLADAPPFQGGVAGLCAYELGARTHCSPFDRLGDWPDLACARYPAVLAFDHRDRCVVAVGRGVHQTAAKKRAAEAMAWATPSSPCCQIPGMRQGEYALMRSSAASSPIAYEAAVADVVSRIGNGEIFQANIARIWNGRLAPDVRPFDLLCRLVDDSPAPFTSYLRLAGKAVVSNSPERFISVIRSDGHLHAQTRPIKGTRPRAANADEDARHALALAASTKDQAENLMIVDLMRNDLSQVCRPGSVKTPELFRLESFANVHHLVSTVVGELSPGRTAVDLLRASLPPGSVTGAPKIQAMKVIAGHEPPRGPFFGTMFWAGADGAMDSSVLIRTTAFTEHQDGWFWQARAGAGIVADSNPRAERLETEDKIAAILRAMESNRP